MPIEARRYRLLLAYAVAALPLVVFGAWHALALNSNSPLEWVSQAFPARRDYDRFRKVFGGGDVVVVSWPGCTADDPRLDRFAELLRRSRKFVSERGKAYFERVLTGRDVLARLTSGPRPLAREQALRRLEGTFFGSSGTTCAIVTFNAEGLANRKQVVASMRSILTESCGVPEEEQHMAGPVIDGLSVDVASKRSLDRFALASAAVIFLVCWWSLRSLRVALLIFGLSLYCVGLTLALVHYCGDTMNALLIVMPPLIQVLAVSGGIHLSHYFFDALLVRGEADAPQRALARGWLPCCLSAGTTSAALASLMLSDLVPVRAFGAYAAVGVAATAAVILAFIPGTLGGWSERLKADRHRHEPARDESWRPMVNFIARHHLAIVAGCVLLMAGVGLGVGRLQTSVRIQTLFPPASRIINDYAWLEREVGPLVPIEVVVHFDRDCTLSTRERLSLVMRMRRALAGLKDVAATFSPADFLPPLPAVPPEERQTPIYRETVRQLLSGATQAMTDLQYLHDASDEQQWRITARASALSDIDYAEFLDVVRHRMNGLLRTEKGDTLPGVSVTYTGIMPLVHAIQRALMSNLFASFLAAFGIIAIVMTIVQGGILPGLVAMLPNVFPTLLLFGLLGWLRIPVDIGSVMTASVALGVAVDDTLHFLTSYRRAVDAGRTVHEALQETYARSGAAMVQTTVICGWGMLAFAFSSFIPTSRFALMMAALLLIALLGDLVLLPALLTGPLGRLFRLSPSSEATSRPPTFVARPGSQGPVRRDLTKVLQRGAHVGSAEPEPRKPR